MAFTNYLTQGQPLPSSTQAYTTSQVPQYLSDYLYNLLSGSYSAAQEAYQPYQGPRIAGFNPMQTQAYQQVEQNQGNWQPALQTAQGDITKGSNLNPLAAAAPLTQGASSNFASANPLITGAATTTAPDVVSQYMNPYQEQVMNRMGDLAKRQLQEKIMPQIGDQFIRAGQYGSSRQQEIAQRGIRDINEGLMANQAQLAQTGYTQATNAAQADLARQLQAGTALGQLGSQQGALGVNLGQLTNTQAANLANLANAATNVGSTTSRLGLADTSALEAAGQSQQQMAQKNLDTAYQDFINQRDYPKQQLQFLSNIVRGLPSGGGSTSATSSSVGSSYGMSPLQQLAAAGTGAIGLSKLLGG